jgi:hypothetical protein
MEGEGGVIGGGGERIYIGFWFGKSEGQRPPGRV